MRHAHLFLGALFVSSSLLAETVKINGSTTVNLPVAEAAEILRAEQKLEIQVDTQGGSSGGISMLGEGLVQIGMTSKSLTPEDKAKYPKCAFQEIQIGEDAVALIVSKDVWAGGVQSITKAQAQAIYEGRIKNWKDLGGAPDRIVFFNKEPGRGTWEVFAHWLYGNPKNAPEVSYPEVGGNEETRNKVSSTRGAISQLSSSWADGKTVFALAIKSDAGEVIAPSAENIAARKYPMSRPLFLLTNGEPQGAAKKVIDFVLSERGQEFVKKHGYLRLKDLAVVSMTRAFSWFFSLLALGAMLCMIAIFAWQSVPVWQQAGPDYVTGDRWFYRSLQFGALPMIYGTFAVAAVALLVAAPIGIGAAIFIAEYLPRRLRLGCKLLIELLAGIPSVVYGLLGILLLRDWIYEVFANFEPLSGDTLLTAGLLLAIMLLPTIVTLADDALRSVPAAQRRAARALGLTRAETIWAVSLRQSARGLGAALLLALGRALGETIAVFLVVGRQDNNLPSNWLSPRALLEAGQTLTTKLGGSETNIAYGHPLHWGAITGLGLLLLIITGGVTLLGTVFRRKNHA